MRPAQTSWKGDHFPHRRHRLSRHFSGAGARPKPGTCQVRSEQPAGGQARSPGYPPKIHCDSAVAGRPWDCINIHTHKYTHACLAMLCRVGINKDFLCGQVPPPCLSRQSASEHTRVYSGWGRAHRARRLQAASPHSDSHAFAELRAGTPQWHASFKYRTFPSICVGVGRFSFGLQCWALEILKRDDRVKKKETVSTRPMV